jgi:hypothetical protein
MAIPALKTIPALALLCSTCLVGCGGDDSGWVGGQRITVYWERYKDAGSVCQKKRAEALGADPAVLESAPAQSCYSVKGTDCFVYTGEGATHKKFGQLVQPCFEDLAEKAELHRE